MSSDPQLHSTLDRLLGGLRGELESTLRAHGEELGRAAAADRAHAVEQATEEVRRQGQEQLAQLREAAKKQNDELRRSAETQIAELRRLLDDIRRNAQQQIDTARQSLETELAAARTRADAEIEDARRLAQSQVEDVQRGMDARLAELGRQLDEARRELDDSRLALDQSRHALDESQRELAIARQDADAARQRADQHRGDEQRLAAAIRALDEATSLSDAFERLATSAAHYADRALVLLLKGDRLREWRAIGFGGRAPGDRIDLSLDEAGIAGTAAREARPVTRVPAEDAPLPPVAASPAPREAAALPVTIAGAVVAVLYADVSVDRSSSATWTASLDVLVRHAGRLLEAITVRQAAGIRPVGPVAQRSHAGAPGHLSGGAS